MTQGFYLNACVMHRPLSSSIISPTMFLGRTGNIVWVITQPFEMEISSLRMQSLGMQGNGGPFGCHRFPELSDIT